MKKVRLCLVVFAAIIFCSGFSFFSKPENLGRVVVLSVSSNGDYAITSNSNKGIILWDIKNKTHKVISKNGNIYSAYFIKNSPYFIWQDLNNYVHVDNVNGTEALRFLNFPVYGQVMGSDLKTYFASDINWSLFSAYKAKQKKINPGYLSFLGTGKLLNLTLSDDNRYLLTSGFSGDAYGPAPLDSKEGKYNLDGVVLWNTKTGQPVEKLPGTQAKTFATFSPGGKYILSGDENTSFMLWDVKTGKGEQSPWMLLFGRCVKKNDMGGCDVSAVDGMVLPPKGFANWVGFKTTDVVSIKFISKDEVLRFTTGVPYAVLYKLPSLKPVKYLFLSKAPWSSVYSYTRDESIDTAPKAHILVTGQLKGNGIIVYKYNPKNQTLKKIWVGNV